MKTIAIYILSLLTLFAQNYALKFSGMGVNDVDRVKIPITNTSQLINIGKNFTIEFEINCLISDNPKGGNANQGNNDDWTLAHIIIDRDIFGPGEYGDYGISLANGYILFGVNNGSESYTLKSNSKVKDNSWNHIALTRDTLGNMAIFINGKKDATFSNGPKGDISYKIGRNTVWPNDPYVVFAAEKHDYDNNTYPSYKGMLDNVRFSNIIRYTNDFNSDTVKFSADNSTVAYYDFNEGSGEVLLDKATIGNVRSNGIIKYSNNPVSPVWINRGVISLENSKKVTYHIRSFPNPFTNIVNFDLANNEIREIKVYDLLGRNISLPINKIGSIYQIDATTIQKGIYFVKIITKNETIIRKINKY